jgi:signal transduction histidine kinase
MERDVQQALDEAARLAHGIHPQLEAGGLAAAFRFAAMSNGIAASVDVSVGPAYEPETLRTVYSCWLEVLSHARGQARATATVREEHAALTFKLTGSGAEGGSTMRLDGLRDRVEALGGRLTVESDPSRGTYVSGSLPVSS